MLTLPGAFLSFFSHKKQYRCPVRGRRSNQKKTEQKKVTLMIESVLERYLKLCVKLKLRILSNIEIDF